jgi:YD repeat-containing protein
LWDGNDFIYTSHERSPNTTYFQLGLLKSITYPTQGKTTFFYEPNQYTHRIERRDSSGYYPVIRPINGFAGGARIAAVENTDGRTLQKTSYTYPAGGILMSWPNYYMAFLIDLYPSNEREFAALHYSYAVNQYAGEPFIHYPEVIERKNSGEGYIHYKYSNYLNTPDMADFHTKICDKPVILLEETMWKHLPVIYSSRYFERGLLTDKLVYNAANQLVEKSCFEYSGIADYPGKWIPSVTMRMYQANSYKIYHCPIAVKRETHTQYLAGGTVSTMVEHHYNNTYSNTYPAVKTTTASDGTQLKTVSRYVDGLRDNASFAALREKNIRNMPVETITYKDGAVVGASLIEFQSFPDLGHHWSIYPSEVLALAITAPITDYDTLTVDPRLQPQLINERYDAWGNVLQQRNADGLTVSYLWSSDGLRRLAEIAGATYEEAIAARGNMYLDVVTPDNAYLDNMHLLRQRLPQALITNYTYKHLVGMTSQTDPNGKTTYYEYDDLNRLKTVRDHQRNVLKEYGYHYHPPAN